MRKTATIIILSILLLVVSFAPSSAKQKLSSLELQGYLLSWNEGPVKDGIASFVESVSDPSSKNFVAAEERRAFFDMDGTILCEKPEYIEVLLTQKRLREKAEKDPRLAANPIYKAALENDTRYLNANAKTAIVEAFAGETLQFYRQYCRQFLRNQLHPRFNRPYIELFYAPMIELMDYLRDHGFKVYIVSTSQQEFIRSISKDILEIPPQQVIGTMVAFKLQLDEKNKKPTFIRQSDYFTPYNADENKVVRIRERGLLPSIFSFGNSGGDLAMLEVTGAGGLPYMACIVDHDDPQREYEYHKSKLIEIAAKNGWTIVSMKRDFKIIFR
jgi:phosphoglycolate phosphatase-like HAD superfamily hydrolase